MTNGALTISEINNYPEMTYNRLFPATLTEISPLHKVMINIVKINTDLAAKDIYKQKNGEYSLTKIGCLKLMTAANVIMEESKTILPQACQRCAEMAQRTRVAPQCGGCPAKDDVAYQVSILVPEPSGGHRRYVATKEVTKADTLSKKAPLEHMGANCETKALLRALRAGLGLKGGYALGELEKPFAVALVVLNTQDPDMKKALIARYAAGQDALFGGGTTTALPVGGEHMLQAGNVSEVVVIDPEGDQSPHNDTPPWELPPCCEVCRKPFEPFEDLTAQEVADTIKTKFGRVICKQCRDAVGGAAK